MARSETLVPVSLQGIASRLPQIILCSNSPFLLHRSQWRCLSSSYSAVMEALIMLSERACSVLEPLEQESMCHKLAGPLHALHEAVLEGETCMQGCLFPSSPTSLHSWLLEKVLKSGMSTEVVDLHLHRLLCTSSVVREQILRCAPIDGMYVVLISKHTRELCDIWSQGDAEDDRVLARSLLNRIMGEKEGDTRKLASFILQKLSCSDLSSRRSTAGHDDLPPFLWVDPKDFTRTAEVLGEGGYGMVQEGAWLGGRFAIKNFFYVEDNVAFGREALIQAQLHHPNVIPLVCCSQNPRSKKCSLVMECMEQDLRVLMMQRMESPYMETPFPLLLAVDLMLQISLGMEYLHSDGLRIMHRDLKSSNILVSYSSTPQLASGVAPHVHLKVADFGMSKAKYASSRYTTRQVGATPWRAPEVFEDGGHPNARYTNKADVYSFAMVCYEILTGKSPFEDTPNGLILSKVLSGQRPSLPKYCPSALASYIERCWHTEPDQRPTFTQICRMLRYFKACISLQDHDQDHINAAEGNNWLVHPLPTSVCLCIDDMLRSVAGLQLGNLRPQLLVIPLEMYCCRVVLQHFTEGGAGGIIPEVVREDRSSISMRGPSKGYFNRTLKGLKKLFGVRGGKRAELRAALGLMGEFTYKELRVATNNFSATNIIGEGGSGKVYHGELMNGQRIAVKVQLRGRFNGEVFVQELRIASQLRHRNIVPLLGWCLQEQQNLLLVYEYMPNGDLRKHIFSKDERVFGWQQRYKVVGQVAAALKYLHQDSGYRQIVHRDVKTLNIMLDSEWNARLGDCGLAVLLREDGSATDLPVAGTFGFLAPEAVFRGEVSPASDVYSFGVTVLEIATGRKCVLPVDCDGAFDLLIGWVWEWYEKGEVLRAADVLLSGKFDESEMRRLLVLGLACTHGHPDARPTVEDVLRILSMPCDPPPPRDDWHVEYRKLFAEMEKIQINQKSRVTRISAIESIIAPLWSLMGASTSTNGR